MSINPKPDIANPDLALIDDWGGSQSKPTTTEQDQGFGTATALGRRYAAETINWNNNYFFQWLKWDADSIDYIAKNTQLYVDNGSSGNAFVLKIESGEAPASYDAGTRIRFFSPIATTGACTINVESIGVKDLVDYNGSALGTGAIGSGDYIEAVYDLTNDEFRITPIITSIDKLNTKGDLLTYDGTGYKREAIGSNGQYLVADSTQTNGIKWQSLDLSAKADINGSSTELFEAADGFTGKQVVNISQFTKSTSTSGYQKLPSGIIIQWGEESSFHDVANTYITTFTFPIAFPTTCIKVIPSFINNTTDSDLGGASAKSIGNSSFVFSIGEWSSSINSIKGSYIAIGY